MSTRLVPVLVLSVAWLLTACGGAAPPPHHYAVQADADPIMPTPAAVDPAPVRAAPRVAAARPAVKPRPEPPPTLAVPARVELPDAPLRTFRDWSEYLHDHRFVCSGERGLLVAPVALRFRHGRATLHGWHLDWHAPDGHPEHSVTLGVLGATKDAYPGTLANLDHFLAAFAQEGVDVIIVAGDIGYAPEDIAKVLERLALSGRLVVAITGNAEPIRSFHSAIIDVTRRHQNLIDGNLVRLIQLGPASLVTVPGYFDERFMAAEEGCLYDGDDLEALDPMIEAADSPVVLVSHGPPRGAGEHAIDVAFDAGHVGDPSLRDLMERHAIDMGLFSHILECGGRAVDSESGESVAPETWSAQALLNVGAATSLEQDMHDGTSRHGMAAIVQLGPRGMRYHMIHAPGSGSVRVRSH